MKAEQRNKTLTAVSSLTFLFSSVITDTGPFKTHQCEPLT